MATQYAATPPSIPKIKYGMLKQKHPDYLGVGSAGYWQRLEALYAGGRKLLEDAAIMAVVFPSHTNEDPAIYVERKKRAFYINHAGAILDHLVAALSGDPVTVAPDGQESTTDEFYQEFFEDCSPPLGRKMPFNRLLKDRMLSALVFRRAWTLVDLPETDPEAYASLAEQEKADALDAYACALTPFEVFDWEEDEDGELLWVLRCQTTCRRASPSVGRDIIVETYTVYTPEDWTRYVVTYKKEGSNAVGVIDKPSDDFVCVGQTYPHSFGRVPVARMELPEGLWAMDRLESVVREHFNKECAKAWFEYRCAYQQLYEFQGTEVPGIDKPVSQAQEDPHRAVNQKRGIGYVQVRGSEDRAEFVGPDPGILQFMAESCRALKDEIYRVLFAMALASDNSAAALGRSADSKAQDKAATSVILTCLGEYLRDHAEDIHELVSAGRGDKFKKWTAEGASTFDPIALSEFVEQTVILEGVSIPSPTFQRLFKGGLAKRLVAADASEDELRAIDEELKANITPDLYDPKKIEQKEREALEHEAALKQGPPDPDDEQGGGGTPPGKRAAA